MIAEEPEAARYAAALGNGEGRNRTGDTTIFSRVLYQLSYLAAGADGSGGPPERRLVRSGQPLGLVLAQEALEQPAVALLVA